MINNSKRAVPHENSGTALNDMKGGCFSGWLLFHGNGLFAVRAHAYGGDRAADEAAHAFDKLFGVFRNFFPGAAGGDVLHPAGHRAGGNGAQHHLIGGSFPIKRHDAICVC